MATKKPTYKIVVQCSKTDDGTYEAYTSNDLRTKKTQESFRCPACDLKIILLLPQLELRAHGKNSETIQHKLLMVQEV